MALNKIKEWQLDLSGINAKIEALGKPVNFKGRVDSVDQLPEVGTDGDLYYVGPIDSENKKEYIWYDGAFELLGSTSREDYDSLHNDLDELGDQVAEIESKIPETATDANPLVTKQELLDTEMDIREDVDTKDGELQEQLNAQAAAIAGKQDTLTAGEGISIDGNVISATGGGGSVPDNVYTQDNLIAGKNVTFTEVPPEGGIDEHTIDVFHFDEDVFDSSNIPLGELGKLSLYVSRWDTYTSNSAGKFGKCINGSNSNGGLRLEFLTGSLSQNTPHTIDFWYYPMQDRTGMEENIANNGNWFLKNKDNKLYFRTADVSGQDIYLESKSELELFKWHHIAFTTDGTYNRTIYLNGKPEIKVDNIYPDTNDLNSRFYLYVGGSTYADELRVSDVVRYTEEFTPPTKAYTVATGPSKTAVNAVIPTKTSELENDSGFLTGLPDNVYTQSNLLGGKDIEIVPEPVEGGIDEYTLGVFHYDDASNPAKNSVEGGAEYGYGKNLNTSYFKFGVSSGLNGTGILTDLTEDGDWTVDAWYYCASKYGAISQGVATSPIRDAFDNTNTLSSYLDINDSDTSQATVHIYQKTGSVKSVVIPFKMNSWFHLATERYGKTITVYKDGEPILSYKDEGITNGSTRYLRSRGGNYDYEDELRLSKIARYKGENFTPPTKAYSVAEPTGNMVVNYTGEEVDLSGKADTDLGNISDNIDYVVESYNEGTNWYRVYKSGWVEQGGQYRTDATQRQSWGVITFLKPFTDTNYTVQAVTHSPYRDATNLVYMGMASIGNKTTTKVDVGAFGFSNVDVNNGFDWYACGQGAE